MGPVQRPGADERAGAERVVAWLVVLAVVAGVVGSVWYVADEFRRDVPDSQFDSSFDAESAVLTVTHAGGDPVRDRSTEFLRVVVTDGATNVTETVTWAGPDAPFSKRGESFPVVDGSSIAVDDPAVDSDGDGSVLDAPAAVGFELSTDDEVRVVWRGSRRTGRARTVVLANTTVG